MVMRPAGETSQEQDPRDPVLLRGGRILSSEQGMMAREGTSPFSVRNSNLQTQSPDSGTRGRCTCAVAFECAKPCLSWIFHFQHFSSSS